MCSVGILSAVCWKGRQLCFLGCVLLHRRQAFPLICFTITLSSKRPCAAAARTRSHGPACSAQHLRMRSEQISQRVKCPSALLLCSPAEWSFPPCTFCRPGAYISAAWSAGLLTCCNLSLTASSLTTQVVCSFTPAVSIQRQASSRKASSRKGSACARSVHKMQTLRASGPPVSMAVVAVPCLG